VVRGSSPQSQAEECLQFSWFIVLFHCSVVCFITVYSAVGMPRLVSSASVYVCVVTVFLGVTNDASPVDCSDF